MPCQFGRPLTGDFLGLLSQRTHRGESLCFRSKDLVRIQSRCFGSTATIDGQPLHKPGPSPLAALSHGALLRSLCISGIACRPFLLTPGIWFANLLSKPKKLALLDVRRNRALAWMTKAVLYKQFCAGETAAEVKETMDTIRSMGFRGTILTYAQETVVDVHAGTAVGTYPSKKAERADGASPTCGIMQTWIDGTMKTVDMLGEGDQLAIKLTGAGPSVVDALAAGRLPAQALMVALHEISATCRDRKSHLIIDAESQLYQAGIARLALELMRKYNTQGTAVVYNTYQAYLKSMPSTLQSHLATAVSEGFTLGLKLVRGAYLASDPRTLIHDSKEDTDRAYNTVAQGAIRQELCGFGGENASPFPSIDLVLASHNKDSVMNAHTLQQQRLRDGLPTVPVKFAQLQGMADELSFGLLHLACYGGYAPEVYKCSTWGTLSECLGYLVRRAMENRDAAGRTLDAYTALKKEARRRMRSIFALRRDVRK